MNIRLLKILVISMACLIVIGFSVLIKMLYDKANNVVLSKKEINKIITIKKPTNMQLESVEVTNERLIIRYKGDNLNKILILNTLNGNLIKEIDVLK